MIKICNIKRALSYISFILASSFLMMGLMWSVYQLDVSQIRENVAKSTKILLNTPSVYISYNGIVLGRIEVNIRTDPRMLNAAGFIGLSKNDYLLNPRMHYLTAPFSSLLSSINSTEWEKENVKKLPRLLYNENGRTKKGIWVDLYPRFWHGYLLFLKPLLLFFDLQGIRYINLFFQLGMFLGALYLIYKRLGFKYCIAFMTAGWFLSPFNSWICLEYMTDINIMLLAVLWVLLNKNPNDNWIFFIIGAVTISFGFLTIPLITLGIPLVLYICLYQREFRDDVQCVIKNSLLWLFGYAGMWFSKWLLATLLTGYNVIEDGWKNILFRSYGATGNIITAPETTFLRAILVNVRSIWSEISLIILGVSLFVILVNCVCSSCKFKLNLKALVLSGISLMPFVWYSVLAQHSIIHVDFAYKILAITIYALLSAIICCLQSRESNKKSNKKINRANLIKALLIAACVFIVHSAVISVFEFFIKDRSLINSINEGITLLIAGIVCYQAYIYKTEKYEKCSQCYILGIFTYFLGPIGVWVTAYQILQIKTKNFKKLPQK